MDRRTVFKTSTRRWRQTCAEGDCVCVIGCCVVLLCCCVFVFSCVFCVVVCFVIRPSGRHRRPVVACRLFVHACVCLQCVCILTFLNQLVQVTLSSHICICICVPFVSTPQCSPSPVFPELILQHALASQSITASVTILVCCCEQCATSLLISLLQHPAPYQWACVSVCGWGWVGGRSLASP